MLEKPQWPDILVSNRGKALSVATLGGMIGVMILPMIVVKLAGNIGVETYLVSSKL